MLLVSLSLLTSAVLTDSEAKVLIGGDFDKIISSDQVADFNITISNLEGPHSLMIDVDPTSWELGIDETEFELTRGLSKNIYFNLTPPANAEAISYTFPLRITSPNTNETFASTDLKISIALIDVPLSIELNLPGDAVPAAEFPIKATFKNKDVNKFKAVKIEFDSDLFDEPLLVKKDFDALAEQEVVHTFTVKPQLDAGNYDFVVYSTIDSVRSKLFDASVTVLETGSLVIEESKDERFWKTMTTYTLTNDGNAPLDQEYLLLVSGVERFFMNFDPDPEATITKDGGLYYAYNVSLDKGESFEITQTFSMVPFLVAVIVIGVFLVWLYRRRKLAVRKEVVPGAPHKGKKTARVRIIVKNRSGNRVKNVVITDNIPAPLKLVHAKYATLRPDIIKKQAVSTKMVWKIDSLAPGEERVVTYNLVASIGVVGRITLPPTSVEAKVGKVKDSCLSNTVNLVGSIR